MEGVSGRQVARNCRKDAPRAPHPPPVVLKSCSCRSLTAPALPCSLARSAAGARHLSQAAGHGPGAVLGPSRGRAAPGAAVAVALGCRRHGLLWIAIAVWRVLCFVAPSHLCPRNTAAAGQWRYAIHRRSCCCRLHAVQQLVKHMPPRAICMQAWELDKKRQQPVAHPAHQQLTHVCATSTYFCAQVWELDKKLLQAHALPLVARYT